MIHLKVQQIGTELGIVFDEDTQRRMDLKVGDTILVGQGADAIQQGKAFVDRYIKTFEALAK